MKAAAEIRDAKLSLQRRSAKMRSGVRAVFAAAQMQAITLEVQAHYPMIFDEEAAKHNQAVIEATKFKSNGKQWEACRCGG